MKQKNITAYILAGGKSTRFKKDKSLHIYDGRPLIEHVYQALSPVFSEIRIVADTSEQYKSLGLEVVPDIVPGLGPIGGIYTAISHSAPKRAFITGCDMPSINTEFIEYMTGIPDEYGLIIPIVSGKYEPLHAIYSATILEKVKQLIDAGESRIISILENISVRQVGEDEIHFYDDPLRIFRNINYKNDL